MTRFNTPGARAHAASPVRTEAAPTAATYEGHPGYARDAKSELFLLALANFGSGTFYEPGKTRDERMAALVRQIAAGDLPWLTGFAGWLRETANMRRAPVAIAAEAVAGCLEAGVPGSRAMIPAVLRRADEPGELLAYWMSFYGRKLPLPLKRGVADAVTALYNEYSLMKYDTASHGLRFGDVIELTHPVPTGPAQSELFGHALDRRHSRDKPPGGLLGMCRANAALRTAAAREPGVLLDPAVLAGAGFAWEDALSLAGGRVGKKELWEAIIGSMGYMACLAEGTPVWLADGTAAPVEEVVTRRLPVLSYDKAWDTRPVKRGANQGPRDHSTGNLAPVVPSAWLDMGMRAVTSIRFTSGRVINATHDHRWITQRRSSGRQAWEWKVTADLRPGDRIPAPLTAGYFGDEGDAWDGYFVGAMLGDGGMTALTPEFHGDPHDGAVAFMRDYAAKHGCEVSERGNGKTVRLRFPFKQWKRNPVTEILRQYDVWGKRCEVKALPQRPFSREFWTGALSGLIDTDGCVRERTNTKGTLHGSVEYATVSRRLAEQVSDALLRLGVTSILRERAPRSRPGSRIQSRHPLFVVEVNRATAITRLAGLLDLRIAHKARGLADLAGKLAHIGPAASEMHGYDENVALDRVASIEDAGEAPVYCVTVGTSGLFVANGIVTGNCLRNLRNFDEAGVSDDVAARVGARLADAGEVARSRQFPMRFLSAYRAAPSVRWHWPLERAMQHSLGNIPVLPGSTLILVDTSGSMADPLSERSELKRWDAAALFGLALAQRCEKADVISFSNTTRVFHPAAGESLLRALERFRQGYFQAQGTQTATALRDRYAGHRRVVILTDEQAHYDAPVVSDAIPDHAALYTWNLAGYQYGHMPSGQRNRHTFAGLTDAAFRLIPLLERGRDAGWPWEADRETGQET